MKIVHILMKVPYVNSEVLVDLKNIENPELIQEFILFLSFTIQIFV
jgi:hypothetical protein